MAAVVLDIEQHLLLLELEAPFDKRDVQLARRRMAKRWHPDLAPAGRQFEHERHLKAINEAADQLERSPRARAAGGSRPTRCARAPRRRAGRARRPAGAPMRPSSAPARRPPRKPSTTRSPAACPTTRSSTATRAASPIRSGAWARSRASTSAAEPETGEEVQQWARVRFSHGVRTVPAGSMRFVDFSKPDPAERARRALHDRRAARDGRRRLRAGRAAADLCARSRTAQPRRAAADDARLLEAGQARGGRSRGARLGARRRRHPAAHRFAARIYEDMGAIDLAEEAAERAAERGPADAGAWERLGRLRLR